MKTQIDQKSLYTQTIGNNQVFYSYNTTVAIKTPIDTYVCENVWSVTTAKHLNRIEELTGSNREYRMRYKDFVNLLENKNIDRKYI
jgi:hypothetical protein